MKVDSIWLDGFRCFGRGGQRIAIDRFTCFIGPNASGKTAAIAALGRLFGDNPAQRQIVASDFHLESAESLRDRPSRNLRIECRLVFPELDNPALQDDEVSRIGEHFNQMIVSDESATPYCRIQLEAIWTDDGTTSGDVEQTMWWVLTPSDDQGVIDVNRRRMTPYERSRIRIIYVPAARDPDQQLRSTSATHFGQLLRSLTWGETEQNAANVLSQLQEMVVRLPGVRTVGEQIQEAWAGLYQGSVAQKVTLRAVEDDPTALLATLVPHLSPGEDGRNIVLRELSDGLRSLFSLALSMGLLRVEELVKSGVPNLGFIAEHVALLPALTIFAVEEPENHLSPQYLGTVVRQLRSMSERDHAQVIISTHAPSVLSRVEPDWIRYFLGHENTVSTQVRTIPLPENRDDESYKYVREAIRGYPELYFAKLVVLGEGPSESIVLRRYLEASGTPLDTAFISVVPLGGRHVNHFWKLLQAIGVPFITLLDLDQGRNGGGWGRIQYVRDELVKRYGAQAGTFVARQVAGMPTYLDGPRWNSLKDRGDDGNRLRGWIGLLANEYDVFFSEPLDLDFSMLLSFPTAYQSLAADAATGPRIPEPAAPEYREMLDERIRQVLGASSSETASASLTYDAAQLAFFPWYKYLFLDGSKPVTHTRALLTLSDDDLLAGAPRAFRKLKARAEALLGPAL